ncbi:MAG: ester cyclase [Ramlibacter sp.]|nr:ester cyclase [Ramlibacter sp.]
MHLLSNTLNTARKVASAMPMVMGASLMAVTHAETPPALDRQMAQALIRDFYTALTTSPPETMKSTLEKATHPDWMNCSDDAHCQTQGQTLQRWAARTGVIPEMQWVLKDLIISGSQMVVRGQVTGTPVQAFLGVPPNGRAFRLMTLDVHTVRDGRIARTYHLENWMEAHRQLTDPAPAH